MQFCPLFLLDKHLYTVVYTQFKKNPKNIKKQTVKTLYFLFINKQSFLIDPVWIPVNYGMSKNLGTLLWERLRGKCSTPEQ